MRDVKGQFLKGKRLDRKWTEQRIHDEFKTVVQETITLLSEDIKSPVIPPVQYFRTHPEYGKICSAMGNHGINRTSLYKQILDELNFPYPEKKSGYYAYGTVFRGWYEFCGFCFIKAWGINIEPTVKPFNDENYINDGHLTDYDIHWEHWGELNKKNPKKVKLYNDRNLKLLSTYNTEVSKNNIFWFYNDLKSKLIDMGIEINFIENEGFNPLDLVKGKTLRLKDIYNNVKTFFGYENPRINQMNSSLFHQVTNYFGKFSDFINFCNNNFGESWVYQKKTFECNEVEYCVDIMGDLIKSLGKFPTAEEMRNNGFDFVVSSLHKHGGTETFKRNLYEVGNNFNLVYNVLGDNAPYDKMYDFRDKKLFEWAINYITNKLGEFPKYNRTLRKHWDDDVCRYFLLSLNENSRMTKYKSWGDFQKSYFNNTSSINKQFKSKMTYDQYKEIRKLLDSDKYTQTKIIELTNSGWGTVGRISRKEKRFNDYSDRYENEMK
jgi:hypothetical protein